MIILYSGVISYKYFSTKEHPVEYTFNFNTPEIALTNFDFLIGNGYIYVPDSYYFEKQTDEHILGIRLELLLDGEVIFEFTTGDLFSKYNHMLPIVSKIIPRQISEYSKLKRYFEYTINDNQYEFDTPIKLKN